jgi:VIT1/CCC1 family predicted Fe2+/Mn2+ transporter
MARRLARRRLGTGEMQATKMRWSDASLWVLVASCYATIGGMLFFLVTLVWPLWLTGAAVFTLVVGAPCLILRMMIGHRSRFRLGSSPVQGAMAGVAAFFYLGMVAFFVAGF